MNSQFSFVFAACLAICAVHAQPVNELPVLKEAPEEVLFRAQKQLDLNCVVEGDPSQVTFEWRKDGKTVQPDAKTKLSGSKLVFSTPDDQDAGLYQCFAKSPAGIASTRQISVKKAYLNAPKVSPQKTKPVEGKPFKLACSIPDAYPKPTIEWKKQKDGKTEDVSDGRITISPEGDLYFSNATEKDVSKDFKYVCVAKSPAVDGEVTLAQHEVEGLEKNPKPDNEVVQQYVTPDQYTLKAGQQEYLYCIYGGSPLAHPDWFKGGVNVNNKASDRVTRYNHSKGKRLLIKQVLLEDQGEYTCVIDNEVGQQQKYVFHVNVVSAPELINKLERRTRVKEGQDVVLPCEVRSKPAHSVSWTFNASPLGDRATYNEKGLTIKNVKKADSGYYGCQASNEHGSTYVETLLLVA